MERGDYELRINVWYELDTKLKLQCSNGLEKAYIFESIDLFAVSTISHIEIVNLSSIYF